MPVHGEYKHLLNHKALAVEVGIDEKNIFVLQNGNVLELSRNEAKQNGSVTSGKVFVDGLSVGDVGNIVLRDRRHLSQDGLIVVVVSISSQTNQIVAGPDVISRGFVYMRESEELMETTKQIAKEVLEGLLKKNVTDWSTLKNEIKSALNLHFNKETKRTPMILPVIMEV